LLFLTGIDRINDQHVTTFVKVKFTAFILATMVLWFSLMPCNDVDCAGGSRAQLASSSQHNPDNQHEDACSPFCTCACCANVSFKMPQTAVLKAPFPISSKNAIYISTEIVDVSLPIWQPPQLKA
jgi:hypothetical protein